MAKFYGKGEERATKSYIDSIISDIVKMIGHEYNSSFAYLVGDYVVYNNKLYMCITNIPTGEEWDEAHWTETTIMDAVNE